MVGYTLLQTVNAAYIAYSLCMLVMVFNTRFRPLAISLRIQPSIDPGESRHCFVQLGPDRLQLHLQVGELRRELGVARVEPIPDREERLELVDVADLLLGERGSDLLGDHLVQLVPGCWKRHRFDTLSIFLCRLTGYA